MTTFSGTPLGGNGFPKEATCHSQPPSLRQQKIKGLAIPIKGPIQKEPFVRTLIRSLQHARNASWGACAAVYGEYRTTRLSKVLESRITDVLERIHIIHKPINEIHSGSFAHALLRIAVSPRNSKKLCHQLLQTF